jgi:hypothetical protein
VNPSTHANGDAANHGRNTDAGWRLKGEAGAEFHPPGGLGSEWLAEIRGRENRIHRGHIRVVQKVSAARVERKRLRMVFVLRVDLVGCESRARARQAAWVSELDGAALDEFCSSLARGGLPDGGFQIRF